jgi:hypothetical protein
VLRGHGKTVENVEEEFKLRDAGGKGGLEPFAWLGDSRNRQHTDQMHISC